MSERWIGVGIFTLAVVGLALWPMPSTEVVAAQVSASPGLSGRSTVAGGEADRATARPKGSTRSTRPSSFDVTELAAAQAVPAGPVAAAPRWQLDSPDKSRADWNLEMGELITAYADCMERIGVEPEEVEEGGAPGAQMIKGLRHMFEDAGFDPNSSVGTYQIATDATQSVRELLVTEGCVEEG